jgi:hypothetical protein
LFDALRSGMLTPVLPFAGGAAGKIDAEWDAAPV